jgi:cell division initiation protein
MRMTPLDIRKQPFRKAMRGFDPEQVNGFLVQVADEFETLIKQNNELMTQLKLCQKRLEDYTKIEKTLNDTLLTAQKATDDARLNAQKEAELIIKDAQIRADRYEEDARSRVHNLEAELISLKTQRDSFLTRFKSMLRDQMGLLQIIGDSYTKDVNGGRGAPEKKNTVSAYETITDFSPQSELTTIFETEEESQ